MISIKVPIDRGGSRDQIIQFTVKTGTSAAAQYLRRAYIRVCVCVYMNNIHDYRQKGQWRRYCV